LKIFKKNGQKKAPVKGLRLVLVFLSCLCGSELEGIPLLYKDLGFASARKSEKVSYLNKRP
jgi:hypothetical protein